MFLDANGKEVAKPSNRSVEGFDSTLSDIKALDDLRARISNGEKGLEASCLLREMNLGAVLHKLVIPSVSSVHAGFVCYEEHKP